jgi:hypothetical protein
MKIDAPSVPVYFFDDYRSSGIRFPVYSYGRWRKWKSFGPTTRLFLTSFSHNATFSLRWRPFAVRIVQLPQLADLLTQPDITNERFIAVSQLQHVHCDPQLMTSMLIPRIPIRIPIGIERPLGGIHWRQGDFRQACANKPLACWQSADKVIKAAQSMGVKSIWIASDERWQVPLLLDKAPANLTVLHTPSEVSCTESYMLDMWILAQSDKFIGNKYSTFSRYIERLRGREGRESTYFD